jgi:hypothetical protein
MAPTQQEIARAARLGPQLLITASETPSGPHTLGHIAENSLEILNSISRSGGRERSPAQQIARSYLKVLKALIELDADIHSARVPLAAVVVTARVATATAAAVPPASQLTLATLPIAQSVPFGLPPRFSGPSEPEPRGDFLASMYCKLPLARLSWLFCVYLPIIAVVSAMVVGLLAFSHIATNPETLVDGLCALVWAAPTYLKFAFKRMAAAAYKKVFPNVAAKPSRMPLALLAGPDPEVDADPSQALILIIAILSFGWYLSGSPPARPTRQG